MRPKVVIPLVLSALAILTVAVPLGSLVGLTQTPGLVREHMPRVGLVVSMSLLAALAAAAASWAFLHLVLVRPLEDMTRDIQTLVDTPQDRGLMIPARHALGRLPAAVERVLGKLAGARAETANAIAHATRRAEEQKSRLEAILLDLTEGVIVCNLENRILLYNQAASRILGLREALGLGRSLFGILTSEPVLHTLEQLRYAPETGGRSARLASNGFGLPTSEATRHFMCATVDLGTLLEARLSLVREPSGEISGYVLSFADVGAQLEDLALRDSLLRETMVNWRRPLANLRAATEMLFAETGLDEAARKPFEEIIAKEVESLNQRFVEASRRYDRLAAEPWPMSDVHSLDLFRAVQKHLAESHGIELTLIGVPSWLHVDSHSLLLGLEYLIRAIARHIGTRQLDIGVAAGNAYVYVEVTWHGSPVPSAAIECWLDEPLKGTIGNRTTRQILERHGSELWSQPAGEGMACLRLALQPASRPPAAEIATGFPPRPEFYDFDLFRVSDAALAERPLKQLDYVVFDTETTGLRPSQGDELVSIGAVRIVNGRILTGETFERLIDPGRAIPKASTRIHGISDDMVRGKPPARVVLPQFKTFVGDAVMVAYNAAFDMRFLELKQDETGVRFDNPVLDALLLTIHVHADTPDPSLASMARQLGIEVTRRHTALGDAMLTAAIWVRLLDLLEQRGIKTFGQAIRLSSRMVEERRALAQF